MRNLIIGMTSLVLLGCSNTPEEVAKSPICHFDYTAHQATVTGYCQQPQADLPKTIPTQNLELTIRPHDEIPEVFWHQRGMEYSLNQQAKPAPLVFLIAGTGASYQSPNMLALRKSLYAAGNHVVSVSSPTYSNFIINASTLDNHLPGYLQQDAALLHSVLKKVEQQIKQETDIQITEYAITGYSLGGAHSAFVSHYDDTHDKHFNFQKVLLINPPASLYNSVKILDGYLDLKHKRREYNDMLNNVFDKLGEAYASQKTSQLNMDSLYEIFEDSDLTDEELKLLVGVSFRFSSADMIFAIDTTYNIGAVTYKNHEISKYESISHSQHRAFEIGFLDYFYQGMYPYYRDIEQDLTVETMIDRLSLHNIEDYLKNNKHIALVTNADDIILADGDLDYLSSVFTDRAQIFERGGHCGNMDREEFVTYLTQYFASNTQGVN